MAERSQALKLSNVDYDVTTNATIAFAHKIFLMTSHTMILTAFAHTLLCV